MTATARMTVDSTAHTSLSRTCPACVAIRNASPDCGLPSVAGGHAGGIPRGAPAARRDTRREVRTHGKPGGYAHGCRCDECREAGRRYYTDPVVKARHNALARIRRAARRPRPRPPSPPLYAGFWDRVEKTDNCWLWRGPRKPGGYGSVRGTNAQRIAWQLAVGPIPDGLWVLHRCDNPPCVNPAHLFLGTVVDNNRDMKAKGRYVTEPGLAALRRHRAARERLPETRLTGELPAKG
jgi:hypothetical protein